MQWNKSGRRSINKPKMPIVPVEISEDDSFWTKEELSVFKDPIYGLAYAVVKQWLLDGKPKGCDIKPWVKILEETHDR